MTWDFLKRLRDTTKMKIVIKGILAWEDAVLAADNGIDGIIVSNHGGRSEDSGRSTIDALPEIVEAVKGRMPIFDRLRLPPRLRHRQGAVHGRDRGLRRPALHLGLGAFGQPASSACSTAALELGDDAADARTISLSRHAAGRSVKHAVLVDAR